MDSKYDHSLYEDKIYSSWEAQGYFNPDTNSRGENGTPFSIIMPPPNANDPLHVGHAMFATLEDIMIRYHRMLGDDTLWQPGADHAGIETQFVYEKKLAKQGLSRFQFDRQTLYDQIWSYVQDNAGVAMSQLKKIGASADWSRYKFTLDPDIVRTVLQTFLQLDQAGLIYRDLKLVNYCPKCGTAFSDLEVKHTDAVTPLYYIKYGPFILATTRPETKFGDTAVAIHPDDQRYQKYLGQTIEVEGVNGPFKVKVIADEYVDPEFGTGVVKITPYHDHNDFEVWLRHKNELPEPKQVIDFNGRLTEAAGPFAGLKVKPAREAIVTKMQEKGLIDSIDYKYQNKLSTCYRCGQTLEPLPLAQFFIKVAPLVEPVLQKLDQGQINIQGAGHDKILRNWLTNLRDWNISRQIVWGIRMPVWYSADENPDLQLVFLNSQGEKVSGSLAELTQGPHAYTLNQIKTGLQLLNAGPKAKFVIALEEPGANYLQETDTFDTWFSSSQWPFATLQNTQPGDFDRFYPTSVMETGYDILPFWVMRMLFMGQFATGELPFPDVYLHGLIRDSKGQKMSKSKGNVINPLDIAEKFGADSLRMALVIRSTAGLDKSVGEPDFKAMRNLTNKVWNASRFCLLLHEQYINANSARISAEKRVEGIKNTDQSSKNDSKIMQESAAKDDEFLTKLQQIAAEITQNLNDYKLGLAAENVYNYFWHYFCDEIIELAKKGDISLKALYQGLITFLKLLHPFIPFVTEQIWQEISLLHNNYGDSHEKPALIISLWPAN